MTLTTTLDQIRKHNLASGGWEKILARLGKTEADDEPLPMKTILASNGVDDFVLCLRALPAEYDNAVRLLNCDIAERALRFVPEGEDRPRRAIEVARRFARDEATGNELRFAGEEASAARWTGSDESRSAVLATFYVCGCRLLCDRHWTARSAAAYVAGNALWAALQTVYKPAACGAERAEQAEICHRWLNQLEAEA